MRHPHGPWRVSGQEARDLCPPQAASFGVRRGRQNLSMKSPLCLAHPCLPGQIFRLRRAIAGGHRRFLRLPRPADGRPKDHLPHPATRPPRRTIHCTLQQPAPADGAGRHLYQRHPRRGRKPGGVVGQDQCLPAAGCRLHGDGIPFPTCWAPCLLPAGPQARLPRMRANQRHPAFRQGLPMHLPNGRHPQQPPGLRARLGGGEASGAAHEKYRLPRRGIRLRRHPPARPQKRRTSAGLPRDE